MGFERLVIMRPRFGILQTLIHHCHNLSLSFASLYLVGRFSLLFLFLVDYTSGRLYDLGGKSFGSGSLSMGPKSMGENGEGFDWEL